MFDSSASENENSSYEEENFDHSENSMSVLYFINTSSIDDLSNVEGSSNNIARKIVDGRPYINMAVIKTNKLFNERIIDGCQEMLLIKNNISKLLAKCEAISMNLRRRITPFICDTELSSTLPNDSIVELPKSLTRGLMLKSYQLVGINWLRIVHEENVNGILADEMGLGKTIQTIAFLSHLYDNGNHGPHIIIVPTSTIKNWQRELHKWCPQMHVVFYHGGLNDRRKIRNSIPAIAEVNVVLTTYAISISNKDDRLFIKKMNFHYGVFDEAHMLKNMLSNRYKYISNFKVKRKLLLTGTPLQNNLIELISLLLFVMPDIFLTDKDGLMRIFQMSRNKTKKQCVFNDEKICRIREMLAPFYLRRLKSQVLSQLPKKTVEIVMLPLTAEQSLLYTQCIASTDTKKNVDKDPLPTMTTIIELRKISNHTLLVKDQYTDEILRKMSRDMLLDEDHITSSQQLIFEDFSVMHDFEIHNHCLEYPHAIGKYRLRNELLLRSNKIQFLDENLPKFIVNGDRVLIFSQFLMVLDIISEFLKYRNISFLRIDGSTLVGDRQEYIDEFNDNAAVSVFLLTTRAGGLGINLMSANIVILHDIDYNPYSDRQAEDRCHRIGQMRDVRVIKLISKDTIEECMLHIATEKLKLEQITTGIEDEENDRKNNDDIYFGSLLKHALKLMR